jgi:hypothetical protein
LKDTVERSKIYWEEVIVPALQFGKTVLIVGHENNLRSLLMRLEDIPANDIINLNLPRAVPLAYRLDANFKPKDRLDGKRDEATGFLRGEWLGGDNAVAEILARDHKQVYDTSITQNLETAGDAEHQAAKVQHWMGTVYNSSRRANPENLRMAPTPPPPNGLGCGVQNGQNGLARHDGTELWTTADDTLHDFIGGVPVPGVEQDAYACTKRDKEINNDFV